MIIDDYKEKATRCVMLMAEFLTVQQYSTLMGLIAHNDVPGALKGLGTLTARKIKEAQTEVGGNA